MGYGKIIILKHTLNLSQFVAPNAVRKLNLFVGLRFFTGSERHLR
jgi:hypothetical protein